jgi:CBS domain-containing protein
MNTDSQLGTSGMGEYIPEPLLDIATRVRAGQTPSITLRTPLSWYGAERRGGWRNRKIREALQTLRIRTDPSIESAYIDGPVIFLSTEEPGNPDGSAKPESIQDSSPAQVLSVESKIQKEKFQLYGDPTYRIGRLASANRVPESVTPDTSVLEATTKMLQNDYSQLPVMTSSREVKGMFSWKSLGQRQALGKACMAVRDAIESYYEVKSDESLFIAVAVIAERDCVLVRNAEKKICGIVTTSDLTVQFQQLGEPFLLLGEIENHIRSLLVGKFSRAELEAVRDKADGGRAVADVADLGYGDYLRLLQEPTNWARIALGLDRKTFIKQLDEVRIIRNEVMHFDPDGMGDKDLAELRKFTLFLQRLRDINRGPQPVG